MREISGQVAFSILVLISTAAEESIAVIANVLALHAVMLTFKHLPTFIAPEISVIIVAIAHPLITLITVPIPKAKFL